MAEIKLRNKLAAEMLGVFILTFLGVGSILSTSYQAGASGFPQLVAIALAHGIGLALAVTFAMAISGGHINPAVTISMLATKRISSRDAAFYIVAQVAGAAIAIYVLMLTFPVSLGSSLNWGTPGLASGVSTLQGIAIEGVGTFLLVLAVFGTAVDQRVPRMGGLGIGLMLAAIVMAIGPFTGAAVNPAISLGPAIASGDYANWFVYWIGPIIGAIVAALLYEYVILGNIEKKGRR